jgi:chromosome partitioning protein
MPLSTPRGIRRSHRGKALVSKVIALAQHKGGVGKTSTCTNLGACLAEAGKRVLLIDMDPQAALTQSFGINPADLQQSIYNVLADPNLPLASILLETVVPNLVIAPSHINLAVADLQFSGRVGRERILRKKLAPIRRDYDYAFIDCAPTLGLATINALAAADSVIVPIQCELLSIYGLKHLLDTINLVRQEVNEALTIEGYLLTMYDGRTRLSEEVAQNVRQTFGELVFETIIRRRVKLAEAPAAGRPITEYASSSDSADDYRRLAKELMNHG